MSEDTPTPQDPIPHDAPDEREPALEETPESGADFQALLNDVPLELSVELGRVTLSLRDVAARLGPGSVIPLNKGTGDTLDVRVNQRLVARAEAVAVGERCAIRVVEIVDSAEADRS